MPPDHIRSIDHPTFSPASSVHAIPAQEPVLSIDVHGDARAYPSEILIWHEIVNDTVGGVPLAVTFCPLCYTGIVFRRPVVHGQVLDFGVSGKLYQSNLVMYDRQTDSLWPEVLARAIEGPLTGLKLQTVPAQMVSFGDFLTAHPDGKVLDQPTGLLLTPPHTFNGGYGLNPYPGYDQPSSAPPSYVGRLDPRLPPKALVLGVLWGSRAEAFPYATLASDPGPEWSVVETRMGARSVVVFWHAGAVSAVDGQFVSSGRDVGAAGAFDPQLGPQGLTFRATADGIVDVQTGSRWNVLGQAVSGRLRGRQLPAVESTPSFWFAWSTFHPRTSIFH